MMMRLGANRRIELAGEMLMAVRNLMIESLPKNLSEKEFKKQLYYRTYGEQLPEDFFKDEK